MPMQTVTKPIMLDETGQAIVNAISGLTNAVKPDAVNIPYDNTDSGLVAETVQGAIDENTGAISELNSSLMKCQQVQFMLPQTITINANSSGILLDHFNISTSTITDTVFTNKTLTQLFGGHTVLGVVGLWCSSGLIPLETIVWANTNELSVRFYNQASSSITVTAIRLLVFYI